MATKKEICASALEVCAKHKASPELTKAIEDLLAPKAGGATVNIDEVTKKDSAGKITDILCSVSGKFLPATKDFFYEDKDGKGINGLKRLSRQAESIRKSYTKVTSASEKAIMTDVIEGTLKPEEAKAKLAKIQANKPDYSTVVRVLPTTK
jgi:hypothetical protein